jgi:FkbM family methyltransferase
MCEIPENAGGRVAWCDDPKLVDQLPRRYKACAAYFRGARRIQPRRLTAAGHVKGGSFLIRSIASASERLGMVNRLDLRLGDTVLACDLSEPRTLLIIEEARGGSWQEAFFRSVLEPGDTFMDVGANGGGMTALACRIVGRSGAIYAVEPQPHLAGLVSRTLALNGVAGRAFETAVGDCEGGATLVVPARRSGSATLTAGGPGRRLAVAVKRLDDLLPELGDRSVKLLKLDVEGHERPAPRGSKELRRGDCRQCCSSSTFDALLGAGHTATELHALLEAQGYAFAQVSEPVRRLVTAEVTLCRSRNPIGQPT